MINCLRPFLILILAFVSQLAINAQATYNMANLTVTDCYGTFLDSDAGQPAGDYDHNEDFTFKICPPGANTITLTFSQFCTEPFLDVIRFFDGPDTNSTLILATSGNTIPGPIVATSGCLTIHFKSDANVSCTGWKADWKVKLNPPVPPTIDPVTNISCFSNVINITLNQNISCDSVYAGAFSISGPGNPVIVSANPTSCSGNQTNSITLGLNPTFSQNGNFTIDFVYHFKDICDSVWTFNLSRSFNVSDCPITAEIQYSRDTICLGECVTLTGSATGGDPNTYAYKWSNGIPSTAGPHTVCPLTTTTYFLTVSDLGPSPSDVAQKTIYVFPKPNAGTDRTICRYDGKINLNGSPAGGQWSGTGITNASGTFDPDSSGSGTHEVYYTRNGCSDTLKVNVLPVFAGPDQASCPGAAAFSMTGFLPPGGTWSGSNITPAGLFNPTTPGSFTVTYTAPNGCKHSKKVNVDNITLKSSDTTCTSQKAYFPPHTPTGGIWSGTGIVDPLTGQFNPTAAGNGVHTLTYTLNGCSMTTDIYVQNINAGPNRVSCPLQTLYQIPSPSPSGGYWTGDGIIDSSLGTFNPSWNNGKNYTPRLVYHFNGCTDTIIMYVRLTRMYIDSLFFCEYDTLLLLNWGGVKRTPGNGQWSGPGIIDPDYPGKFDPKVAGPGIHTLRYVANTCEDSIVMVVYPKPLTQADTVVCEASGPFALRTDFPGGIWRGTGIIDTVNGIFNPQLTGLGSFMIEYENYIGCKDSMIVTVDPLATININPIDPFYCYNDTLIPLSATPAGGTFSGPGVSGNNFNPIVAGTGVHTIFYNYGTGDCAVMDSFSVEVGQPLNVSMAFSSDSICFGDYIIISATGSGGFGGNYTYNWNGLGSGRVQNVNPKSTTVYTVTVDDGCSQNVSGSLTVVVHPEIKVTLTYGPKVCYGVQGWAKVTAPAGRNYSYLWSTTPPKITDTIHGFAGSYSITVTDNNSGCVKSFNTKIDGYPFINAEFVTIPQDDCVSFLVPTFEINDNSVGGIKGKWDFGDGRTQKYVRGLPINHTFADTGTFRITLYIENEGGCSAIDSADVCVFAEKTLWVPNAFTPNGDGKNEVFLTRGIGVEEFRMMIFNRWGQKLFESESMEIGWDGTYQGEKVENDVYTYLIIYRDITSKETKYAKGVVAVVR
jgi:gliding motility-associated-like protein